MDVAEVADDAGPNQPIIEPTVTPTASVVEATAAVRARAKRRVVGGFDMVPPGWEVGTRRATGCLDDNLVRHLDMCDRPGTASIVRACDMSDHAELGVLTRTEQGRSIRSNLALMIGIATMTLLVVIDLMTDAHGGSTASHLVMEGAIILIGTIATARFARGVRRLAREARELREHASALTLNLEASRLEASAWRRDAGNFIAGLGAAIDNQFEAWALTPAEREIARLLLKGLSHKEIAQIRNVSETTVRQQAQATYRKAGLSGRNDLAAFFLEDLLAPRSQSVT